MKIYVLRHGITEWNRLKKIQGSADIPLAEEGIELARKTGIAFRDVPLDLCYTSPLQRAVQTADLVLGARKIPKILEPRIQEINFGVLEGTIAKDEQNHIINEQMRTFFEEPSQFERPEGGENISDVLRRTREFWQELVSDPKLQDKSILVSTHGCAGRAILQNVYQDPEHFWHGCVPPNCSISLIEVTDGNSRFLYEDRVFA